MKYIFFISFIFLFTNFTNIIEGGVFTSVCSFKWGNDCIPVYIDPSIKTRESEILQALDILNSKTNSGFFHIHAPLETGNYIRVVAGGGCSSYIGKIGNSVQNLNLSPGCPLYSIVHEFMHAIGIYHEQSRPDRNDYITVFYDNIQSGFENNFAIGVNVDITPPPFDTYDYNSVMHYSEYAFSKNGQPTIDAKGTDIGNRNSISDLDIQTVNNALLECGNETPIETICKICLPSCRNGGICNNGICDCNDTGFSGKSCQDTATCNPSCRNSGICNDGMCDCNGTGYTGQVCDIPVCKKKCNNGGKCVAPNTCDCTDTGYTGSQCDIPVCNQTCKNGGKCIAPNVCDCSGTSYTGNECEIFVCLTKCLNGGKCIDNGVCDCAGTGYSGVLCENAICIEPCTNGKCVAPNVCDCLNSGFTGKVCDVPICNKDCINGICIAPNECVCNNFWSGDTCETPECDPECAIDQECRPGNECQQISMLSFNMTIVIILLALLIFGVYLLIVIYIKKNNKNKKETS